jgi:superfamily I DNA/RNA helicase
VLPALREAGITYAAIELDALSERQAILDLAALTHALIQPADRFAWLAALRAPWCGLRLADLVAVVAAAGAHPSQSIAALLEAPEAVTGLSDDGRDRFVRLAECLRPAIASRGRAALASRVRGAWLALGGGALQDEPIDIGAAERFFSLLAQHDTAGTFRIGPRSSRLDTFAPKTPPIPPCACR